MIRTQQQIHNEWLVVTSQSGQAAALGELLRRWHERLLNHARSLLRNDADAADALQEALIGIAKGIRRLDDPAHFEPWARRILAHKCADLIRARQRTRSLQRGASDESLSRGSSESTDEEQSRIRLAIDLLSLDQRALIAMRYGKYMSTTAMAAALGVPEGTIKSRLNHARTELQSILERSF